MGNTEQDLLVKKKDFFQNLLPFQKTSTVYDRERNENLKIKRNEIRKILKG